MSKPDPEVRHVDPIVMQDLASKYADVKCPVHGVAPSFDVQEDGSVVETICCAALLQIVRELQAAEATGGEGGTG